VYRDLLTAPACANRIPLDTLAANAHAAHPKGTLDYARIKAAQDGRVPATQVRVSGRGFQDDVFLDPCTGKVLGQRGRYGGFVSGAPRKSLETYWQHVQSLVPNPAETLIHFPSKPREPAEIFIIGPDAPHANARTMLFLDACSDEVLSFTPYAQNSLGMKVYFLTLSMHTGQIGG